MHARMIVVVCWSMWCGSILYYEHAHGSVVRALASMCSYDWNVEMCDILLVEWLGVSLVDCPLPTKQCFLFTTHDSYGIVIVIVTGGHGTWKLYSLRLVTCV